MVNEFGAVDAHNHGLPPTGAMTFSINNTRQNGTQHNNKNVKKQYYTQHNDTQCWVSFMSVSINPIIQGVVILSVIFPIVIIPSVVAPSNHPT